MKVNKILTKKEKEILPEMGIVLGEDGQAHFEERVPPGMKKLPSGKLIPWISAEQLLVKF